MTNFEVYRKRGRHWEFLCVYTLMKDSNEAARRTSYVYNLKVVGVRPEGSRDKILVYRFQYVAGITG